MKIVFLDRDGVIIRFPGRGEYVTTKEQLQFIPKALEAIRLLTDAGFEIYIASNQGCVSRKMITEEWLWETTRGMLEEIERAGGKIKQVFYCVHQGADNCGCKKPKIEMFQKAAAGRKLDLKSVYFIGDSEEDIGAGTTFGCRMISVLSGRLTQEEIRALPVKPEIVKKDLWDAATWITQQKS